MLTADNDQLRDQPWKDHTRTFVLRNARVVAVLDEDGGAIVETHPALEITEGRMEAYATDGEGRTTSSLDYGLAFAPKDAKVGDYQTGYGARIVLTGTTESGRLMEIRGHGFIGQDELGQLDGIFHDVPSIYVPDSADLAEHVSRQEGKWSVVPQGEFVLATYGRDLS